MRVILFIVALVLAIVEYGATESLPKCASVCVGKTTTKCKATDYICACSKDDYIARLMNCVRDACDVGTQDQTRGFLLDLCSSVGSPIVFAIAPLVPEEHLEVRQDAPGPISNVTTIATIIEPMPSSTFSSRSSTLQTGTSSDTATHTTTSPPTNTPPGDGTNGTDGNGGKHGLSTGAKIGIGVGIPLGLFLLAGLLFNAFWLGRRSKQKAATAGLTDVNQNQEQKLPQMANAGIGLQGQAPAELDGTMYMGSELPTLGNTAEMEGQSAPGHGWNQQQYAEQQTPGQQYAGQQYMGQQGGGYPVEMAGHR